MKPLKKVYEDLNAFYASLDILKKWMNSKKGHEFAKRLGREPLDQLIKRFQAPDIKKHDYIQKLNSYKYAVKVNNLQQRAIIVKDYDKKVKEMKKDGLLKLPKSLTKEDRMKMETYLVRDIYGNMIKKQDREGKIFWSKRTNKPIYVRKRKSNKIGLAMKCHLYELHKMAKWDKKNPAPEPKGLSYDIFPKELIAAHKTRRHIEVERVRNMISERFCGVIKRTPKFHLYSVHYYKSSCIKDGFGVYEQEEVEPDRGGYDFLTYTQRPPWGEMMGKLVYRYKHFPHGEDSSLMGLKLYDDYGNVIGEISFMKSLKDLYCKLGKKREKELEERRKMWWPEETHSNYEALGVAA